MSEGFPPQPPSSPQQPGQPLPPGAQTPPSQPGYPGQGQPAPAPIPPQQVPGSPLPGYQQPGYQQPPGFPGTTVEPPKKKSRLWLWLLITFGVLVLGVGGCITAVVLSVKGPIDKSNEFLAFASEGDYGAAFQLVNPACATGGPEDFPPFFDGMTSYDLSGGGFENSSGNASGTITFNGTDVRTISFTLTNQGGWQICGFDIGEAGSG